VAARPCADAASAAVKNRAAAAHHQRDEGAFQGRHITLHQFSPAPAAGPLKVNLTPFLGLRDHDALRHMTNSVMVVS